MDRARATSIEAAGKRLENAGLAKNLFQETLDSALVAERKSNHGRAEIRKVAIGMTLVKSAFLFFAMLSAIVMCGFGIYSADAGSRHQVVDGYGVVAHN